MALVSWAAAPNRRVPAVVLLPPAPAACNGSISKQLCSKEGSAMQTMSSGCKLLAGHAPAVTALPGQQEHRHIAPSSSAAIADGCQHCNAADGFDADARHRQGGAPGIEGLHDFGALPAIMWASCQLRALTATSGSAWRRASNQRSRVQPMHGLRENRHARRRTRGCWRRGPTPRIPA